jgi:hypothetical protein
MVSNSTIEITTRVLRSATTEKANRNLIQQPLSKPLSKTQNPQPLDTVNSQTISSAQVSNSFRETENPQATRYQIISPSSDSSSADEAEGLDKNNVACELVVDTIRPNTDPKVHDKEKYHFIKWKKKKKKVTFHV